MNTLAITLITLLLMSTVFFSMACVGFAKENRELKLTNVWLDRNLKFEKEKNNSTPEALSIEEIEHISSVCGNIPNNPKPPRMPDKIVDLSVLDANKIQYETIDFRNLDGSEGFISINPVITEKRYIKEEKSPLDGGGTVDIPINESEKTKKIFQGSFKKCPLPDGLVVSYAGSEPIKHSFVVNNNVFDENYLEWDWTKVNFFIIHGVKDGWKIQ